MQKIFWDVAMQMIANEDLLDTETAVTYVYSLFGRDIEFIVMKGLMNVGKHVLID